MQTAEPGVYAIGDIVLGTPQLAHVGAMEGICRGRENRRQARQADQSRAHPRSDLLPSGNRQRRPDRNQSPRSRIQRKDRQVSLHRQLARFDRRPARRLHQDRHRRRLRRNSRRTHHRPAGDRIDRRSRHCDGTRSHGRRFDVDDPRASNAGRSHAGCVE